MIELVFTDDEEILHVEISGTEPEYFLIFDWALDKVNNTPHVAVNLSKKEAFELRDFLNKHLKTETKNYVQE